MKGKTMGSVIVARWGVPQVLRKAARWMAYAGAGILFARASVLGIYTPFACAWVAAVPAGMLLPAAAGALIGTVSAAAVTRLFASAAAVVLTAVIRWALSEWKQLNAHPLFAPLSAAISVFATEALIGTGLFSAAPVWMVICQALLAGCGAWFFVQAEQTVRSGMRGMSDFRVRASCAITGGVLLAALAALQVGPVSVGRVLALMIVLFCAMFGARTGGCVSGTASGAMLAFSAGSGSMFPLCYGFTGLITGCFAPLGRFAASAALLVTSGVTALLFTEMPVSTIYEATAAAVLFLLIPSRALTHAASRIFPENDIASPEYVRRSVVLRLDFASRAIAHVSQSVEEVSQELLRHSAANVGGIYDRAVEDTCRSCGLRMLCWEENFAANTDALHHLTPILTSQGRVARSDLPPALAAVCKRPDRLAEAITGHYEDFVNNESAEQRITEIRSVVASQFRGVSDMLHELAESFQGQNVCDEKASREVRDYLTSIGLSPAEVVCSSDPHGRAAVEICAARPRGFRLKLPEIQRELERICGRRFGKPGMTHSDGQLRLTFCERACFEVQSGLAQHICSGAQLCGDHSEFFHDGCGHAVLVLSDGMGSGGRAAVDAAMACGILSRLILSGLGYDCALRIINSSLYVKSGDESLATVDVATVDLYSGRATFRKAGAAIGFVRRGKQVSLVDLASLPAGILQDVRFASEQMQLSAGDLLVLVSDGALAAGTDWIGERISTWTGEPQALCEELLRAAITLRSDGHDDDVTVAALQLIAVGESFHA